MLNTGMRNESALLGGSFNPVHIGHLYLIHDAYSLASMLGMPGPSEEYQQVLIQAGIAAGLSLIIAGTDWILGKVGN